MWFGTSVERKKKRKGTKKEGDTGQRELTRIKTNVDGDILVSIDLQASEQKATPFMSEDNRWGGEVNKFRKVLLSVDSVASPVLGRVGGER